MKSIRIGSGAGFSGDRIEPAVLLASKGKLNYLVLECLAERTIALAQKRKMANPNEGYDPLLERRIRPLIRHLANNKVRLISNLGAANPIAAAKIIKQICAEEGSNLKIAAVLGDDVLPWVQQSKSNLIAMESGKLLETYEILSANAYVGIEGILEALKVEADIIITGRVADPSLFLAPMVYEFGWGLTDWDLLGKGTIVGHLLECGGQLTGGYFANLTNKQVPELASIGFPFADVTADGLAIFGKVEGTGGILNLQTAKEQLLYEVVNPHAYLTPDVTADFMSVRFKKAGENQVQLLAGSGHSKPETLKVSVGYKAFFQGEGEISYGGSDAVERGKLAGEIVNERLKSKGIEVEYSLIGVNSLFNGTLKESSNPKEVRLRVVGKVNNKLEAQLIGEEVEALYTNGPAGGGGVRKYVVEQVGIVSVFIPREIVQQQVILV